MAQSKNISIQIGVEAILKDVARRAYTYGDRKTDDERVRWMLQSAIDVGRIDHIYNAMSNVMEEIESACEPYIIECAVDEYSESGVIEIVFLLPENTSARTKARAERLIRSALVEGCMAVWKEIMLDDASLEVMKMNKMIWELKVLVNTRIGVQKLDCLI
jgi:hypothetical protein